MKMSFTNGLKGKNTQEVNCKYFITKNNEGKLYLKY